MQKQKKRTLTQNKNVAASLISTAQKQTAMARRSSAHQNFIETVVENESDVLGAHDEAESQASSRRETDEGTVTHSKPSVDVATGTETTRSSGTEEPGENTTMGHKLARDWPNFSKDFRTQWILLFTFGLIACLTVIFVVYASTQRRMRLYQQTLKQSEEEKREQERRWIETQALRQQELVPIVVANPPTVCIAPTIKFPQGLLARFSFRCSFAIDEHQAPPFTEQTAFVAVPVVPPFIRQPLTNIPPYARAKSRIDNAVNGIRRRLAEFGLQDTILDVQALRALILNAEVLRTSLIFESVVPSYLALPSMTQRQLVRDAYNEMRDHALGDTRQQIVLARQFGLSYYIGVFQNAQFFEGAERFDLWAPYTMGSTIAEALMMGEWVPWTNYLNDIQPLMQELPVVDDDRTNMRPFVMAEAATFNGMNAYGYLLLASVRFATALYPVTTTFWYLPMLVSQVMPLLTMISSANPTSPPLPSSFSYVLEQNGSMLQLGSAAPMGVCSIVSDCPQPNDTVNPIVATTRTIDRALRVSSVATSNEVATTVAETLYDVQQDAVQRASEGSQSKLTQFPLLFDVSFEPYRWYHVALELSRVPAEPMGTEWCVRLFVNQKEILPQQRDPNFTGFAFPHLTHIRLGGPWQPGSTQTTGTEPLEARIRELHFYDRVLTPEELHQDANAYVEAGC